MNWLWNILKGRWAAIRTARPLNALADALMRYVRPAAFIMIVAMFWEGWKQPNAFATYADALSKLPDRFWDVAFLLLGSIASTKLVRDLKG